MWPHEAARRKATYRRGQIHDKKRQSARSTRLSEAASNSLLPETSSLDSAKVSSVDESAGFVRSVTAAYRAATPLLYEWTFPIISG